MVPRLVVFALGCALIAGCRSEGTAETPIADPAVMSWHQVGSWSGHGDKQTESFTSDTGGFRVRWETSHEAAPGQGRLRVVFRSGDSGREIMDAVDEHGVGQGTSYVGDRPRWYFLTIESTGVDWSVAVDETAPDRTK
jgi:hypothetical protein